MTLYLVRHAHAGDRYQWHGDDAERPISPKGVRQTEAITAALAVEPIGRVLTSPYTRCRQTVAPLAERLSLQLELEDLLAEGNSGRAAMALAKTLADTVAVLCSHGDVIPELLSELLADGVQMIGPRKCEKGSIWRIDAVDGRFTAATYLGRPGEP